MNKPVLDQTIPAKDQPAFFAAVQRGIADADAGRTVPFEQVKAWLLSWGKRDELPPPECK